MMIEATVDIWKEVLPDVFRTFIRCINHKKDLIERPHNCLKLVLELSKFRLPVVS